LESLAKNTQGRDAKSSQQGSQQEGYAANMFIDRFQRIMVATGASTDSELARILNIQPPSVGAAKKRRQIPTGWIEKVSEMFSVSADWLFWGTEPMRRGQEARPEQPAGGIPPVNAEDAPKGASICDPEIMLIPKVKARLSAGGGSLETNGDVAGYYAFRRKFLNRKGNSSQMVLMDVAGDSMEPELKSGDTVLIDKSQTEIIAGSIYAVGMEEEVVVKVVDRTPGKLILRSYNPMYAPYELDLRGDLSDGVRIIGRVIWWCREAR